MTHDVTDAVTLENFPLLAAPQSGLVNRPERQGTRFIVGRQGLYWDLTTAWLHAVQMAVPFTLQEIGARTTPYGEVLPAVETLCSCPPKELWAEFLAHAREALPNEAAALLVWNSVTDRWRLGLRVATVVSGERIDYNEPRLEHDEIAVVDVHSHGDLPAFFSPRDDEDDRGGIKVAVVFGHLRRERPEVAARLVCVDRFIPMRMTETGWFEMKGETP
jgi:PRTRC genetic system protein A